MVFEDVRPHIAFAPSLGNHRGKASTNWGGYFYLTVVKVGQVYTASNKLPFRDFPVQPQWVMSLLQAQKITAQQARDLAHQVGHGVTRLLADLVHVEQHGELAAIQAAQQEADRVLSRRRRPFQSPPQVLGWLRTFDEVEERYKFLVLEGPTRVGKTAYARSLCPAGQSVYEENCAAGGQPDLRGYHFRKHGPILLDEI